MDRLNKAGQLERAPDPETVQRSKLRIDALKWLMSKHSAARYGDKLDLNVTDASKVAALSDAALEARLAARLQGLGVDVPDGLLVRAGPSDATH